MSRYPGTQFKVYDNSQATAIVPVTQTNQDDAVQYLTAFSSVKGPEGINLVNGNDFYTKYGTQDNIDFKKYGQPLFQASMNINNGATLLAKRVVFDDAALGNATVGVVLTKYKNGKITVNSNNTDLIENITFDKNSSPKYSLSPLVFSIDSSKNQELASLQVNEYKERYELYKDYISNVVSNEGNVNNTFLNRLGNLSTNILSGYSQSIYYDENGNIITDGTTTNVRKVQSVTTGVYNSHQKTYSTSFSVSDITNNNEGKNKDITSETKLFDSTNTIIFKLQQNAVTHKDDEDNEIIDYYEKPSWVQVTTGDLAEFKTTAIASIPIDRIINVDTIVDNNGDLINPEEISVLNEIINNHPEWQTDEFDNNNNEYVMITSCVNPIGYTNTTRLLNDLILKESGYIVCEYVFPMFTIFDNGRGNSIKSIGLEFDSNTSITLKKAIYTLNVYNLDTDKKLESFSFSLNPYIRNSTTGYTFDIESAVNYDSNQISVKTYYDSFDALQETLQTILDRTDDIIGNYDILFGHAQNGKFNAYSSYSVSNLIKRYTYIYDYAHLDIFDNDIITINAYCDYDNMTSLDDNEDVKYYYYRYNRVNQMIHEKLEFGSDGYCLERESSNANKNIVVPLFVIHEDDVEIIEQTGLPVGTIITDDNLLNNGVVPANFAAFKIKFTEAKRYKDGEPVSNDDNVYYVRAESSDIDVYNSNDDLSDINGYVLTDNEPNEMLIYLPYSQEYLTHTQYTRFFGGEFDKDIFNLDIYFPNAIFDANYSNTTKLAIQKLVAYRGDLMCYMDMGIGQVHSYNEVNELIPSTLGGLDLTNDDDEGYYYVRDMHISVTCISYKLRNPYDNKVIEVTGTYGLSNLYISHFANNVGNVFAGVSNGITIDNAIPGSVNYLPKIYPTSEMTSLNNIGGVYPSEDETIINEKQLMCDLRVNYGCYYNDRLSVETEYTMNPTNSEFSYWNNVALVCLMMQSIRQACPAARYQFITSDDLTKYQDAVEIAIKPWRNKFAGVNFKYIQDDTALENKIFYAAIEVVFKPFAQAEIFELTALNYSTLSTTVTSI